MDNFNVILQAISSVGFPIVFCVIVYKTMVDSVKLFNDKLTDIIKQHAEESQAMQKSLDENTSVIARVLDKLGGDDND